MFRRFRSFIHLNARSASTKSLLNANLQHSVAEPAMLDIVQEIAIYIHRFHNLDLFQQGWYQIKISTRWEDDNHNFSAGTPSRVVQYEAPDVGSFNSFGLWRIDDVDHSFSTQPFRIKYARQDVLLSVMISFNFALDKYEVPSTSAVILKFELLYSPSIEHGSGPGAYIDTSPASVHEFRIPPRALLGFHSYFPVHFDAFHAVLIDLSLHVGLLNAGAQRHLTKVSSELGTDEDFSEKFYEGQSQLTSHGSFLASKEISLIKAFVAARDILLKQMHKLGKEIGLSIHDLIDIDSKFRGNKFIDLHLRPVLSSTNTEVSDNAKVLASESQNALEKSEEAVTFKIEKELQSLSMEDLLAVSDLLGTQLSSIWNVFLNFHRTNRTSIIEYLREEWINNQRSECSLWLVQSEIDVPHRYLKSGVDVSTQSSIFAKVSLGRKAIEDPPQAANIRAEQHRRNIAQVAVNNMSIQDMDIFADPLHVPVLLVEHFVMNVMLRSNSCTSSLSTLDKNDESTMHMIPGFKVASKLLEAGPQKNGRILRAVIFVHGFQGHHLDLRLVRNQWLLIDPGAECLMSEANEDKTTDGFREMGARLAEEVTTFIRKKMDKASKSGGYRNIKLSFVGHSIGNIIIRSALADSLMEPYLKYLYTYMSVSGPHLGYLYSSNTLFNSGLWLLKKLRGAQCFYQLTLTDDSDLEKTFFYKLCKQKTLEYFKNIILISSPQDGYVPYHSARIELCPTSSLDSSKRAHVFMDMLNNCLDQIRAPSDRRTFMRCDVNFNTSSQGRNFDTIIGRAAHIEFLESDIYAKFIMWSFTELFQ